MRVSKWGNSLAVRLPKALVAKLGLQPGDKLDVVSASKEQLTVNKDERRKAALDRLAQTKWKLPDGYKFDRDEANER